MEFKSGLGGDLKDLSFDGMILDPFAVAGRQRIYAICAFTQRLLPLFYLFSIRQ